MRFVFLWTLMTVGGWIIIDNFFWLVKNLGPGWTVALIALLLGFYFLDWGMTLKEKSLKAELLLLSETLSEESQKIVEGIAEE